MGSLNNRLRLPYLDGLRAAAALYVVMFHAVMGFVTDLSGPYRVLKLLFGFGHEAVAIFIVLSGYCLMLPVVRSTHRSLDGSFVAFMRRRAFRILPPYFAALAVSLVLIRWVPILGRHGSGTIWDDSLPGFDVGPVVSHLLLVHNWFPEWAHQINGPLWSVATEWQIYFAFPLLLLPLWQRFGPAAALLAAAAVGYAPLLFAKPGASSAAPWYLLLFALGMLAAGIGFSERPLERALHQRINWARLSLGLCAFCALGGTLGGRIWFRFLPLTDLFVGLGAASLLVYCTSRSTRQGEPGWLLRILESQPLVGIGRFSYSLYLTHLPVVALCYFAAKASGVSRTPLLALSMLGAGVPASLIVAYAFHCSVERHFLKARA